MPFFVTVLWALIAGLIPALFWLWFWLREDQRHPEPKRLIITSFLLGMAAVPLAVPFEEIVRTVFHNPLLIFFGWALVEELLKYGAAYVGGMHTQAEDEPIDAMVYLVTAALGFSAAENALFLFHPLAAGEVFTTIVTGNIRFIGTTLLHVLASALLGAQIAFSFYRRKSIRIEHAVFGVTLAVALHALFNFFILSVKQEHLFFVFAILWVLIIGLLLIFERVKRIRRNALP